MNICSAVQKIALWHISFIKAFWCNSILEDTTSKYVELFSVKEKGKGQLLPEGKVPFQHNPPCKNDFLAYHTNSCHQ